MSGNRCRASRVLLADGLLGPRTTWARTTWARTTPISNLPAFGLGDQLGRAFGQLLHGAVEGRPVGGSDHLRQPLHELERARRELLVHRAARRRQRQERLPQVRAVGAPRHQLALL